MKIDLWRLYSVVGIVTFIIFVAGSLLFSIVSADAGLSEVFNLFWRSNLYLYFGLLVIGITAFWRWKICLLVGISLLYPVAKIFYDVFIWGDGSLVGLAAWIVNLSSILGVITEIICLILIFYYFKQRKNC